MFLHLSHETLTIRVEANAYSTIKALLIAHFFFTRLR
jgi:hypothetical protein